MSVYLGSGQPTTYRLGSLRVSKLYLGSTEVWTAPAFEGFNAVWQDRISVQTAPGTGTVADPYTFKNVSVNGIATTVGLAGTVSFCGKVWSDTDINIYKNGAVIYNIADLYSGGGGVYDFCFGFGMSTGDTIQLGALGNLDFYAVNYTSGSSADSLKVWWQA